MKFELLVLTITGFFIMDVYHDGKYSKMLKSFQKYYKMATIGFMGLSFYLFVKKNPNETKSIVTHANGIIRHLPIDRNATDILSPLLNVTSSSMNGSGTAPAPYGSTDHASLLTPQQKRMMNSGHNHMPEYGKTTKRSVSETKKKYVAAQQQWNCDNCNNQLDATFEVDHKIDLQYGGSNHVSNLVALCRNCHGKKTMMGKLNE